VTRQATHRALLVFARDPVPGQVKTRLIPALGADGAAALYRQLLGHTLVVAAALPGVERTLWTDRPDPGPWIREAAAGHGMTLAIQCEGDLGQRMNAALAAALASAGRAVLIGSDCPGYATRYLEEAFRVLDRQDAVLGPAADGGYVLVGLRRPAPALFQGVDWSTGRVLDQTRAHLRRLGLGWSELPTLHDVDTVEDLARMRTSTWSPPTAGGSGSEGAGHGC
jgi:rSAM/selenodomain-associated transferase 1